MEKPWQVIKLDTKIAPDGIIIFSNLSDATAGLMIVSPKIFWVVNTKLHHIFMGGHYHPTGTQIELLAPLLKSVDFELHSKKVCEIVTLDPSKNEALIVPCGVEHLARIQPGGIVVGAASNIEQDEGCCERMDCYCRSGRG